MTTSILLARLETALTAHPGLPEEHEALDTPEYLRCLRQVAAEFAAAGNLSALAELVASAEAEARS